MLYNIMSKFFIFIVFTTIILTVISNNNYTYIYHKEYIIWLVSNF